MEYRDDTSRLDAFLDARQRAMTNLSRSRVLRAVALPMLADMARMGIIAIGIWGLLPVFHPRVVEIPVIDVTHSAVTVPDITMKPVEIQIPRVAPAPETSATAPRSPDERRFEDSKDWQDPSVVVRGRIVRQDGRGFVLATAEGEQSFYPAKIGPDGRPQPNLAVRSVIAPYLGDLCVCSQLQAGTFHCVALHDGEEHEIAQISVAGPTSGKPAIASSEILVRLEASR
jgi:hypothetical protein